LDPTHPSTGWTHIAPGRSKPELMSLSLFLPSYWATSMYLLPSWINKMNCFIQYLQYFSYYMSILSKRIQWKSDRRHITSCIASLHSFLASYLISSIMASGIGKLFYDLAIFWGWCNNSMTSSKCITNLHRSSKYSFRSNQRLDQTGSLYQNSLPSWQFRSVDPDFCEHNANSVLLFLSCIGRADRQKCSNALQKSP
jgi:hypothetical protein